jgi:hypothetical protein
MRSLFACVVTLLILIIWFLRSNLLSISSKPKISPKQPKTELYSNVRSQVRTGDLIMTRASNNLVSDLHCKWLKTPISHVGIAVVESEGSDLARVFMFESSAGRGAQLRDLEDYARNGVSDVFIKHLNREQLKISKETVLKIIESFSKAEYSFKFLADIPHKLMGLDLEGSESEDDEMEESYSCADLVYNVYKKIGIVINSKKRRWFPKDFFLDKVDFLDSAFSEIRSVFFNDLDQVDKKRISVSLQRIFDLLV